MPAIWVIDAYRAGERRQVHALARAASDALGWTCETLQLRYRQGVFWPHLLRQATLAGVRPADRDRLDAPWPDLVITAGVRNEPVGRWLQRASGGRTRYVHVGRPWGHLDDFDLLVTTPQYRVSEHRNVLQNDLTLHDLTAQGLAHSAAAWRARLAHLPRPWIGVLVGGNSGPYTLGPRAADRLLDQARAAAARSGGSLLITTSARTPATVNQRLRRRLAEAAAPVPYLLQCWSEAAVSDNAADNVADNVGKNAYPGILALADGFVVTADSIAMLSEACATGRPVFMFDCGGMRRDVLWHAGVPGSVGGKDTLALDRRLGGSLFRLLMRYCPDSWSRDISLVHRALEHAGRASWLEDDTVIDAAGGAAGPPPNDLTSPDRQRAVARIEALVAATG